VTITVDVLGGKWKPLIVHCLLERTRRFAELRRLVHGVTAHMLTAQLRELERDGIVHREVFAEVPPRVEYSLTARGEALRPVLEAMVSWGTDYLEKKSSP
jgi:DNA-binding HxlR family transcriptional regulator